MRRIYLTAFLMTMALAGGSSAYAIPLLSNDAGTVLTPGDSLYAHYEYGEELQRNKLARELELEIIEVDPGITQDLIEQDVLGVGPLVSFMSSEQTMVALPFLSDRFTYSHLLPPAVVPDVIGPLVFNDLNFTANLIEFELELKGIRSGSSGSFEVRLAQAGVDVASLGTLAFDSENKFKFKFKQLVDFLGGTGIAPEIYTALGDGSMEVSIVRTSGTADLFFQKSELELEMPAAASGSSAVPEPSTVLLLGSGLAGLAVWRKKKN